MQPFVIHAHFYQPSRMNPWTGHLDPEPSAAPDRDWNERVHRECYRPNAVARIFGDGRRVERIVNNYERLSFNFGPTLLRWLAEHHEDTYRRILDADHLAVTRDGHGTALAQAYHHTILPLSDARDRMTQIRWGLVDFRQRFGRHAEGMWLPETAANAATLDALIDAGVAFTVLAPHQAARVRPPGGQWQEVHGSLDTGRAYRHRHSDGSGRFLAVMFYDGGLAQGLAFDPASSDAAVLVERLTAAASGSGLVHAAVDGETFGHHRRFGELGLAYVLFAAAERRGLSPTSYAAWLAANPPVDDVELATGEGTSWSCAHGLGRWSRDCGCATDSEPGWNQAWRAPLRRALEVLRAAAAAAFEQRGAQLLKDPWAARDDYVEILLGTMSPEAFLQRHARRSPTETDVVDVWSLLECQRFAMAMFTSCAWFFADLAGIETLYVLRFAARVLELLDDLGMDGGTRSAFLDALGQARSNKPGAGTGVDVWRAHVEPAVVTPQRVAAHLCLLGLTGRPRMTETPGGAPVDAGGQIVTVDDQRVERRGRTALLTARLTATSVHTARRTALAVVGLHLGDLDFHGLVSPDPGADAFTVRVEQLWQAFPTAPMARLIGMLGQLFSTEGATEFGLDDVLPTGRQEVVGAVFNDLTERFGEYYARLYHDHRRTLEMLVATGYELPRDLRAAAELALSDQLERQVQAARLARAPDHVPNLRAFASIRDTVSLARAHGYRLDLDAVREAVTDAVTAAAARASASLDPVHVAAVEHWLDLAEELGLAVDLSRPQEHAWEAACRARAGALPAAEAAVVARLGDRLGLAPPAWTPPR